MANDRLLEVKNLRTSFNTPEGKVRSVDGVSFFLNHGETLAIVGESGCGKTVTSLSLMHLLPDTATVEADGMILEGEDISHLNKNEYRKLRGSRISMIFQEPMTSLNPVYRIDRQLGEVFKLHNPGISKQGIWEKSVEILKKVGVPNPEERLKVYPHQLSGGLRQRVMIGISLAANPKIVIADEPTTALDVTIQAQILALLKELQANMNMSIILITHDFGVVSQIADRVAVMYAGKIIEEGTTKEVLEHPKHPYTKLLIMAIPGIKVTRGERLESINGTVPSPLNYPPGCRFADRCPYAMDICRKEMPKMEGEGGHRAACFLKGEEEDHE